MAAAFLVVSLSTARLVARWGRSVITAGGVLQAVGLVTVALAVDGGGTSLAPLALAPGLLLAGVGQAMVMSPLIGVVLADVPAHEAGAASGLFSTLQQSALALGVAVYGTVFLELLPHVGAGRAYALGATVQIASAVGVVAMSRRLPAHTRRAPVRRPEPVLVAEAA
jgi:MFS family permease